MAKPTRSVRSHAGFHTSMFQRRPQPTTTGQLLLEDALFAAKNRRLSSKVTRLPPSAPDSTWRKSSS
jgi:hypothetical protein